MKVSRQSSIDRYGPGFLLAICLALLPAARGIEFKGVSEAGTYGWRVTDDTELTVTRETRDGAYALKAQPMPGAGPYRGFELCRNFDLGGAGAADTIVFHVKQNFGSGMRVQLWTKAGGINRGFPLNRGDWTRVELDLDPANWERQTGAEWGEMYRMQFYETSFQAPDHYMILDGLAITVGGKSVLIDDPIHHVPAWTFPRETPAAWYLGTEAAAWAIARTTGQVRGGWNVENRERYLDFLEGRYHWEDRESLVTGRESADRVLESAFSAEEQRVELTCSNPELPGLAIRKQYWVDGNKLFQKTVFRARDENLQFITYNTQAAFVPFYRDGGYYMGGADGGGPLVPAPQVTEWQKVVQYQNTTKGMLLYQPEKGTSFSHTRTRLDDQFVWPWFTGAIASYCERMNVLHYTPDGWDMSLGTSKLSLTEDTSYEQYVSMFEGDWQTFLRSEYPSLPAVQQALDEIPPVPDWVADVKVYTGSDIDRLKRLVEATDEGTIMVLVDFGGSWADYYVDRGLEGGWEGGSITAEEIRDVIARIKAVSPRIKVGIYMWVLSTAESSRIYGKHPEWFRTFTKDGQPASTFPGMATNYAHLLSVQECYDGLLSQFDLVLGYLGTDFIYLDDPKAINMIDWESGEFTRDDQSFRFMLDIKRIAAKHGPDKVVFYNNRGNPYADINFIEARSTIRASYWRSFVGICAVIQEFVTNMRPEARIIPLYYIPPHERDYMNRVLAMGWIPSLEYGDAVTCRAFLQAAYEIGNCRNVPLRYSPDCKRDKQTNVESYAVQREGDAGYLLSFISHAPEAGTVPIELALDSFELDPDRQVFVWQYVVADATEFKGQATESQVRSLYAETGRQVDRVTQRKLVYAGPYRKLLPLDVTMEPLLLYQFYVTSQPMAVYAEDDLPANYLFGQTPRVALSRRGEWEDGSINIQVDSERDQVELMAFLPSADHRLDRVTLDGQPVEPTWVREGDDLFPVMKVGKGRHTLALKFTPGAATTPAPAEVVDADKAPAAMPELGLARATPAWLPGRRDMVDVNRTINGLHVLRSVELTTSTRAGTFQPKLEALMARADPNELLLEGGTTRKMDNRCRGAAFAGFEIKELRTVRIRLGNTFHDAFHSRGLGHHVPNRPDSANFAGIVVDYHTPEGYTRRVRFGAGVMHPKCSSEYPDYGKPGAADAKYDLGASMIEGPEQTLALDLRPYAPENWDGQVWLSVGSHWIASDRRLTLQVLAANDAVTDDFHEVTDPRAFLEAYNKPRTLLVPRSPGGIVIDGTPDEEMWRGAAKTERFFLHGGRGVSEADTEALVLYDDTDLYVAFICKEPGRPKPLIQGGAVWDDDEVEVWIDANGDGKTFKQVIVNAANEMVEYSHSGRTPIGARSAVYVAEGNTWMVEMTIPFAGLGVDPPKPGESWRISLCRYRPPGKGFNSEMIVWAALQKGGFNDLENFGTMTFK